MRLTCSPRARTHSSPVSFPSRSPTPRPIRRPSSRSFAIVDAATDELLGSIARHGPFGHRATFGYWLVPQARGRGAATRALRLITDWTIATTELIRLDLFSDVENDASGRVAERVGFEREGVRRAWDLDREGRPIDVIFYVLVRDLADGDQVGSAFNGTNR